MLKIAEFETFEEAHLVTPHLSVTDHYNETIVYHIRT